MQIKYLHKNIYRWYSYARTQECLESYRRHYADQVTRWSKLRAEGVSDKTCQEIVGISRATYFRHQKILRDLERGILPPSKRPLKVNRPLWGEAQMQQVLRLRRENPTYGKAKLAVILKRDFGISLSESTVGRILTYLKSKGLITKSISAPRVKRKRTFATSYAKPWTFKIYKDMSLGERVQIDHMTVTKNGVCLKHFQAWDRHSKYIVANVFSHAKSRSAKRFLIEYIANCPFKVKSIQVDGGSEFMAEFEQACQSLNIPLIVLPPRKPQYNGGVERANRTFQDEFYANPNLLADSLGAIRAELKKAVLKYNTYRPHHALKGDTHLSYIKNTYPEELNQSQSI